MADDNVSNAIKNLNDQITRVDRSLSNMMNRYDDFKKSLSKDNEKNTTNKFKSLETGVNTARTAIRNLVSEIKNLKKSTSNPEGLKRLDSLLRQLNMSYAALARVTATVNRGQQNLQALGDRVARAFERGQKTLAAFNREQANATKQTAEFNKEQGKTKGLNAFSNAASNLSTAIASVFGLNQIRRFASEVVKVRGEFEMTEVALKNIIGSEVKSQQIWKKTLALAVNSPFTAQQLLQSTKQLAAFRIETSKLYDTTKMLADVSIGLGVDVQRLNLAYGHTKASGFLRGMYARQFATAGVNIYGELAEYYTKIEGKLVTFKDVYERISKKMVSFADVEKVFEKITSKGGQFYNMQEVLSNTVQGQINKIKDTWQQAMNDIGKSQTGIIRGITANILGIIKNWRTWLSVIEGVTAAFIVFKGLQLASVMLGVAKATETAGRATMGLSKALSRSAAALAANPFALAAAAIAALTVGLVSAVKHMNEFNKAIDENNLTLYNARQNILSYEDRLEANNKIIEDYKNGVTQGEEAQKAMSNAQSENADIVGELKSKYPEYTENLKQNKDGIVELTSELQSYNRELQLQIALQNRFKQGNIFNQGLGQDADQFFTRIEKDVLRVNASIGDLKIQLANLGIDERDLPKGLRDILEIDFSNPEKALKEYNDRVRELKKSQPDVYKEYGKYLIDDANKKEIIANVLSIVARSKGGLVGAAITNADDLGLTNTSNAIAETIAHNAIDLTRKAYREFDKEFQEGNKFENGVQTEFSPAQTMVRSTAAELRKEIEGLPEKEREAYNELIRQEGSIYAVMIKHHAKIEDDIRKGLIHANDATRNTLIEQGKATNKTRQNTLNERLKIELAYLAAEEKLQSTAQQLAVEESKKAGKQDKDKIAALKQELKNAAKEYQGVFDWFAEATSGTTGENGDEDPDKKGKKTAGRLISLIKEMRAEYDKLSKSAYGFAKSEDEVRKSYAQAVDEILGKAGVTKDYDFTTNEGMIAALEKVKAYALTNLGKDAAAEVEKYIGQLKSEIEINAQVKIREDFVKDIEKAFNDYELTLELDKLNISPEAAKDLFPEFDSKTLGELQDAMHEEDLKAYKQWADKIDAEILKARKERAKQYSKYLEKEYSERAKLEMQYARDVAFIKANMTDDTQRENILANMQKKYQNDLNELNWKSFKESDFYVEMMDDLASLPRDYMQMMLNKIEEILQHPETLSPRALKEAINARQKVLEAQMSIEPLDVMRSSLATINQAKNEVGGTSWKDTKDKIHEQIASTQQEIEALEEEARCWDATAAAMQVYEDAAEAVTTARGKLSTETQGMVEQQGSANAVTEYQSKITSANAKINELEGKESLTTQEQDQLNALRATVEYYEQQVALLNELIIKEQELAAVRTLQVGTAAETERGEGGVGTASAARGKAQGARDQANQPKQKIQNLKQYLKAFTNFDAAFAKFNAAINSTLNAVAGMGNSFYDMFDALGGKTDALTEGWKEFGNTMISSITNALTMIPMMVAAFTAAGIAINSAMGIIGLIAEALNLLMIAITAISKLHDAGYEKEIENQQKRIDDLKTAYERLEKAIEKTWDTASYIDTYNQQLENIKNQIIAISRQRAAENAKKKTDDDKIKGYNKDIQDAYDELEELEQKRIEVFGGIGEIGYRDAASDFVDAWKDAFLETSDGLQGLQDHFDEFLQEWFVKQATMRIAGKMLEPVFRQIDRAVDEYGTGGTSAMLSEIQNVREMAAAIFPDLSLALEDLAGMFGVDGEGSLSGLAAGIQGMTEEQANILEAYWNSVRMYTASIDSNVSRIAEILGAGGVNTNPQLIQLQLIQENTRAISNLLSATTKSGHPQGGYGIKVFND